MSVLYCIPTANPQRCSSTFQKWKDMGYLTAALTDDPKFTTTPIANCDYKVTVSSYRGWAASTNHLIKLFLDNGGLPLPINWFVAGGDDMDPDPNERADEIARECEDYFQNFNRRVPINNTGEPISSNPNFLPTLGVMQPHGDTLRGTQDICGSPWLGRFYCLLANQGRGPLWPDYLHFFADEELFNVAGPDHQNLLLSRPDLTQYHHHYFRKGEPTPTDYQIHSRNHWHHDKRLFLQRKANGFPGSELALPPVEEAVKE